MFLRIVDPKSTTDGYLWWSNDHIDFSTKGDWVLWYNWKIRTCQVLNQTRTTTLTPKRLVKPTDPNTPLQTDFEVL